MSRTNQLGFFAIVAMTLISVANLRNLPMLAQMGYPFVFYVSAAALFFLLPAAFASSFLSSLFASEVGGVYLWVKAAFSRRVGLFAIWLQWIENVFYYPILLTFIVENAVAILFPQMIGNQLFMAAFVPVLFIIMTLVNQRGISASAWVTEACTWGGLIIPVTLIVFFGFKFLISNPQDMPSMGDFLPKSWLSIDNLTPAVVIFCGIEIATVHAADVRDAKRIYPLAILSSSVVIYLIMIFGALTVIMYSPDQNVDALTGLINFFQLALGVDANHGFIIFLMVAILLGMVGVLNNWIISPTRGLQAAFIDNQCLSNWVEDHPQKTPVKLLWLQAFIVIILCVVYLFLPVGTVYSLLNILLVLLYMPMYLLLFLAAIRLSHKVKESNIPFSQAFIVGMSCLGIIGSLVVIGSYLIKPTEFSSFSDGVYYMLLIVPFFVCVLPALLLGRKNA